MHARHCRLVLLWGLTLLLGACAVTSTTLTPPYVVSEHTDTEYTTLQRALACKSDFPFDAGKAFEGYGLPLLWTFQVNFDATSDWTADGRPLGCLRLYKRNDDVKVYQAIDDGGIVVDTCRVSDPSVVLDPSKGIATLDGTGYVTCTMRLESWVTSLVSTEKFSPTHVSLLTSFVPTETLHVHEYPTFTMIVSTTLTQIPNGEEVQLVAVNPLIHYGPSDAAQNAVNLSVHVIDNGGVTFPDETCHPEGVCQSVDITASAIWWYDYRAYEVEQPPYLVYRFQDNSGMSRPWRAPDDMVPPAPVAGEGALPFWIGDATLYIGHNPETGDGTHGIIDDIIVDPSDSKPTNSYDP